MYMYNTIYRDSEYINRLKNFIYKKYNIDAVTITPAKRGYYGETWQIKTESNSFFIKLDYVPRHKKIFQNSLSVVEYICNSNIDFINKIVKTRSGELYSIFNSAVMGVFEWIDGVNIETDKTKIPEYQMLCKIFSLTKQGFNIPTTEFSNATSICFYEKWKKINEAPLNEERAVLHSILTQYSEYLSHCALRLSYFASLCDKNKSDFYITHGDAGGNFLVGNGRNYIVDWDEVTYAPLERDAWVMCCRGWAVELFNNTLSQNNIKYKLLPERLAFFCYNMFFHYLCEFLDDFTFHNNSARIKEYLENGWIKERIKFADTL